jgi:lipopolysaccharide assembly outer membrane protein LptD (OstA)
LNATAFGGQAHYWFGDHVKVGVTTSRGKDEGNDNSLDGADVTIRKSSSTWAKLQVARSKGSGLSTTSSQDGGYNFSTTDSSADSDAEAMARRVDISVGLKDLFENGRGRITLYNQELEAGYSAPGLETDQNTSQIGGTAELPITTRLGLHLKVDKRTVDQGLETEADEADLDYQATDHWKLSSGVRRDSRTDNSPDVPLTQEQGDRTDVVAKALYDSKARWSGYGFGQESVETSGNREENGRLGVGGGYRVTDRFKLDAEVSDGDLGAAGRLGTEYRLTDRTTLYLKYTLENDRSDDGLLERKGSMASGFRTRYSDSASVYLEERYTHGDVPTGLMHSTGVDLAPTDRLNLGAKLDFGTLQDNETGARTKRTAAGLSAGYGFKILKISSAFEYRVDDAEQEDTSTIKTTSWLLKNNLKYQLSPDWRFIGKLNYARSVSSQGQYYDGNYTEVVLGYAYRPVDNDRLNALIKYTYFYNMPTAEQTSGSSTEADVIERSHIVAFDVMYDLTSRWTVGGKYAYRLGQVSMDRDNPEYFDSRASLYVARADWHFVHQWDALLEGRLLDLPDAEDRLSGVLMGIYLEVGNHIKVGAGYNFSRFSDDLTDLGYRHQGVFINIMGTM